MLREAVQFEMKDMPLGGVSIVGNNLKLKLG